VFTFEAANAGKELKVNPMAMAAPKSGHRIFLLIIIIFFSSSLGLLFLLKTDFHFV